jgi:4,5-dihydroxyphthalate decarboxylase
MGRLSLTLACGRYDRTLALTDGRVRPEGVDLNYIPMEPEEIFWRMTRHSEFDASEFSLGAYTILCSRRDMRFVAIPVFPSRSFRHSCVYVNTESGIEGPHDLRGKRVGTPDYSMTANIWIRGFLENDFGVKPTAVSWFTGGLDEPGRKPRIPLRPIEGLSIRDIGPRTLSDMLQSGEIDALMGAREPGCFHGQGVRVKRLWPNYREIERDYFRRTRIFPMMHTVVIRRDLYEQNRWLALSLFKAFSESKTICFREMASQATLKNMLPWLICELEDTVNLMGEDYWPYGIEPNRKALETFAVYSLEQGLLESPLPIEQLFAEETREAFRI